MTAEDLAALPFNELMRLTWEAYSVAGVTLRARDIKKLSGSASRAPAWRRIAPLPVRRPKARGAGGKRDGRSRGIPWVHPEFETPHSD